MGMDSVELIMKLEDGFAIAIPNIEAGRITTVQQVYDVVWKQVSKGFLSGEATGKQPLLQREDAEQRINEIIADHTGLAIEDIQPHKSLTTDLGMD